SQVPFQVRGERRYFLACKWLIDAANTRRGKSMSEKLSLEILEASNGEGTAVRIRRWLFCFNGKHECRHLFSESEQK
ncbi:MAG: hypothetical protein R6V52_07185, partial [Bacteroidales bacterium]